MKHFLYGPAGSGKTTKGIQYLDQLITNSSGGILVYVPQRTLAGPYYDQIERQTGNLPEVMTIGGLSKRMVELFWPMITEEAGIGRPGEPPIFLNLETAQYFMARVIDPLQEDGLFESVTINRNRLNTQILDNLNKAALNGYGLETLGERLKLGDIGDPEQVRIYQDALTAARAFRAYCLQHNLVDFSLQLELFRRHLWSEGSLCRSYLKEQYRHLIADNLEETTPAEHDVLRDWLPGFENAMLIFDTQAGYRTFLGADPNSAFALQNECDEVTQAEGSYQSSAVLAAVSDRIGGILKQAKKKTTLHVNREELEKNFWVEQYRFYPEMLDGVADRIFSLIEDEGVSPGEIVVLSAFLSDALRYSLSEKLAQRGLKSHSHRPSRSLRDEPVSQALYTLALIAHPEWSIRPTKFDLAYALLQVIAGMDLVRAQLLAESVLVTKKAKFELKSFDQLSLDARNRITYTFGERYDRLIDWIMDYQEQELLPLDHFWSRLFGGILSQPGFSFHEALGVGEVAANLIDSARNFRWMNEGLLPGLDTLGKEYLRMMQEGVIAAQYIRSWELEDEESVLLAPAYTFLMRNKAVDYQFWLDIGSHGWHERIYQPLTHPFVLNRNWPIDRYWSDADEVERERKSLFRLVTGLLRRCRNGVIVATSDLSESGYVSEGLLIRTLQRMYQEIAFENGGIDG